MKLTVPAVAVVQSGIPAVVVMVAPVQKISDSGIVPLRTIGLAVLAVTVPRSIELPVVSVDVYVVIRTKNVWLAVVGLVTPSRRIVTEPGVTDEEVRVKYGAPLVVLTKLSPLIAPLFAPSVAEVVRRPAGSVQVPLAVVQYCSWTEPTAVELGTEKLNK